MNLFRKRFLLPILLALGTSVSAQVKSEQAPVADMLDSLMARKMFSTAFNKPVFPRNNKYKFAEDSVPVYDDYTYQARLAKLDALSPFDLVYNEHVKGFIQLYTVRKRESVQRMMGMAQLYYPMFEEVLDRYNIPLELKHLAVIESALIPYARSKAGAVGLWQFMYPTGKMYGLNVTSYIDERCNPYKATVAAAEYLKMLYTMFGDWQMVLAAYNAGPGTISKAIRRSGGKKTYWEIRPFLPLETQGYVPAFIAANYVMTYGAEHNLYPALPRRTYFEVDTVVVKEQMSFTQLSQALTISEEELLYFNPQYRKNVVPAGGNALCLPRTKIATFLNNEQQIYAALKAQAAEENSQITEVKHIHTVKSGERLSTIAKKYGVTIADLATWNYLGKKQPRAGKKLVVYTAEKKPVQTAAVTTYGNPSEPVQTPAPAPEPEYRNHRVKSGETLYRIAAKYNVQVNEIVEINKLKSRSLSVGQTLKIPIVD